MNKMNWTNREFGLEDGETEALAAGAESRNASGQQEAVASQKWCARGSSERTADTA